jgi:Flp pilus assembly protein TadD
MADQRKRPQSQASRPTGRRRLWIAAGALLVIVAAAAVLPSLLPPRQAVQPGITQPIKGPVGAVAAPEFLGHAACTSCHSAQAEAWRSSQHARTMQPATAETVLGNFDGARFKYNGITSTFFRKNDRFFVRTDGPDGKLGDFEVKYTFGVHPLQQYLIEFPDGRMQALSIAWDARPEAAGGARWFHLYPGERIDHRDELHWTRLNQNWNYRCAECHSTNLRRNYDATLDRYATTWSDINVACEACHGPGSNHVAWAQKRPGWERLEQGKGLAIRLDERRGVSWLLDAASGNSARSRPLESHREAETCAICHSRRAPIGIEPGPTGRILDTHDLSLLREGLYDVDGQQLDEVYVHGSFLQSKMYAKGVTCSDCHEPHTQKLRAPGNAVCAQCHAPAKYDVGAHHLHRDNSAGAECAACHMPARNYMVIDLRHDHSIRIPRPDLTLRFGVPNACNVCHTDKDASWAAAAIENAYGSERKGFRTFAETLHAGRTGAAGAPEKLAALASDPSAPGIARATAIAEFQRFPSPAALAAIERTLTDADPLVRGAALDALLAIPQQIRTRFAERLIDDPVKAVRVKAGRALAAAPLEAIPPEKRAKRERAFAEYVAAQEAAAERPEAHLNLGIFHAERGDAARAETEYRTAIRLQPDFAPAYANLTDLYRALGREPDAAKALAEGLKAVPAEPSLLHALALQRVREARTSEALRLFKQASETQPANARFAYVYAVALHSARKQSEAINVLRRALEHSPNDPDVLFGLAAYNREAGRVAAAREYAQRLAAVAPQDSRAQALLGELGAN